ncbi:hypothetical protein FKM82_027915 [Ascaphus truei]
MPHCAQTRPYRQPGATRDHCCGYEDWSETFLVPTLCYWDYPEWYKCTLTHLLRWTPTGRASGLHAAGGAL